MAAAKGFVGKQKPIAIGSIILVVIAMTLIMTFGKTTGSIEKTTDKTSNNISVSNTNTDNTAESPSVTETTEVTNTQAPTENAIDYKVQSVIVIQGDRAMEIYSVAKKSLESYSEKINEFAKHLPHVNVYVLIAPTAMEFYGPETYRTGGHSQAKGISTVYTALSGDNVKSVNAYDEIAKHTGEYIFFRTDHHWTARGAYYAYRAFSKVAGFEPTKLEDHETGRIDGFVGSMYTYTHADVLKENPDYVEYFKPISECEGMIYTDATMTSGRPLKIISETVSGSNKYLCFVEGDNPVEKITSANKNGKKIAIVKESYGNAFAPFLIDNYEEVYILDPRKGNVNLKSFVKDNGITDVLFLNYPFAPSNPTYKSALVEMLK